MKECVDRGNKSKKKHDKHKARTDFSKPRKDPKTSGCFFCDGPHLAENCTKKGKLNAVVAEEDS